MFFVCRCTIFVLPRLLFILLFPVLVSLTSSPWSGVGVVTSSSLLASAVSTEPLIYISRLYLFDSSIFLRFLVVFQVFKIKKCWESVLFIIHLPRHNLKKYFTRITRGNLDKKTAFISPIKFGIIFTLWDYYLLLVFNM